MAEPKKREIFFVFHGKNQSKRSQELQDAKRRAHAARQSARRKRDVVREDQPSASASPNTQEIEIVEELRREPVRKYPTLPPFEALLERHLSSLVQSSNVSPLGLLSQSMEDPFRTSVVGHLPVVLQKSLHTAQTTIWPTMVPLVPREQAVLFYRRSPIDTPSEIDHQIDAAAAIALASLQPKDHHHAAEIIALGKKHRQRSIAWVNESIANATGPPESKLIGALVSLASHSGLQKPSQQYKYPTSPVFSRQFVSLFGAVNILDEDVKFLHSIVELKGGTDWVGSNVIDRDLPLRLVLNSLDVFIATSKGTPPMWKGFAAAPTDMMKVYSTSPVAAEQTGVGNCRGFTVVRDARLQEAVLAMKTTLNALELYIHNSTMAPPFELILQMRMFTQHQLLMLYPDLDTPYPLQGLDKVVHSAGMLFSDLILLTLSPYSAVRTRLMKTLRRSLEEFSWALCQGEHERQTRFWALMLLGIGSITRDVVDEYAVSELRRQTTFEPSMASWHNHQLVLQEFLWWSHNLTAPAVDVWLEVEKAFNVRKGSSG